MKITQEWLQKQSACQEGIDWATENKMIGMDGIKVVIVLIKSDKLDWANWLIVRLMSHNHQIQYAIYAAEPVLKIYEKKYPDDKTPRLAIEAAKKCVINLNTENKTAAHAAALDTFAAAADSASYAADASFAADAAAFAAFAAAANAADSAGHAATAVAYAARPRTTIIKIFKYGLKLLLNQYKL